MPTGETKDGQRRRHLIRNDVVRVRELCGSTEDLSLQVPRSKSSNFPCRLALHIPPHPPSVQLFLSASLRMAEPQMTGASRRNPPEVKTSSGQEAGTAPKVPSLGPAVQVRVQVPLHPQHQQRTINKAKALTAS